MRLLIKAASLASAQAAAGERGIWTDGPGEFDPRWSLATLEATEMGLCETRSLPDAVNAWYNEPAEMTIGEGYPNGTLIHFEG